MKFALLGDDPVVWPLVRVLAQHPEHALACAAQAGELQAELLQLIPAVRLVSGWEELLSNDFAAVIVCGKAETIGEAAKQLAAAGKPLVVFPQGEWDTELIYELSLLRDDNGVRLIPICERLLQPGFEELISQPAEIGHLKWDWELESKTEITQASLRNLLLPDVALLRRLGGEYHQVTAVESTSLSGGIVMATVTLTGDNLPDAVWSLRPVNTPSRWQLTITRPSGVTTSLTSENQPAADIGKGMLRFIEASLTNPAKRPDWTDLTRDYEVLDAVRRSLARRRTIDLHFETTSERSLFKTQMTAMGCGVLLLTMFAVIGLLILGSVLDARGPVELAAANADTIFYAEEFVPESAELTPEGKRHWDRVETERHNPAIIPILVEQADDAALSERRRDFLAQLLKTENIPQADQRVEVLALKGPWFATLMKIARFLVFLPLFVFLALQTLLLITRPAQVHQKSEKTA